MTTLREVVIGCAALCVVATSGMHSDAALGAAPIGRTMTTQDLLSLRELGGYTGTLSVSPNGRAVAVQVQQADIKARTYKLEWYVVPFDHRQKSVVVGAGGDLILGSGIYGRTNGERAEIKAQWSPNGKWIAYLRKESGQVQIWRSRADGSIQEQVTNNAADVTSFAWKPTGDGIYFQVGRSRELMARVDQDEADHGYLLDDRFSPDYSNRPLWYPCDEEVWGVPAPASQRCAQQAWVVGFGAGEHRASVEEDQAFRSLNSTPSPAGIDGTRKIQDVTWDSRRQQVTWLENEDPQKYPGYGAPLTLFAGATRCDAVECRGQIQRVWWSGNEVIFLRMEGHANSIPALYAWQPKRNRVRLILRFDGALTSCEVAGDRLFCLHETPQTPRKIVAISISDGALRTIFDPNPTFPEFQLGTVERIEWKDEFGNDAFGHLVFPASYRRGERYPLVVVQYRSRGFLKGGVGEEYPIYPLSAQGFVVLSFDRPDDWKLQARCKLDSLEEFRSCQYAEWKDGYKFRRKLSSLEIILDRLDRDGKIDPAKVGITGLSDGAETVDYALFNSNRFAAAAHSGHWSPAIYDLTVNSYGSIMRGYFAATSRSELMSRWKPLAIAYNAEKVDAPLLIQVSDRELISTVPNFVALRDAEKPIEAYVFPEEYHIKWQPQHKLAIAERTIDWFRFWLKNEEDTSRTKVDQYVRWRALRALQVNHHTATGCQLSARVSREVSCKESH